MSKKQKIKLDESFYELTVEDIQNVAEDVLERELNAEEIKLVANRVGDYISWYDAIELAIEEMVVRRETK